MQAIALMEDWEFADINPKAEPLFVAPDGRILRYALRPGQVVQEHNAPHSPVYIVVLKGHGIFAGAEGKELRFGPHALIIVDAAETFRFRAEDDELVFVAFLREAPGVGEFPSRTMEEALDRRKTIRNTTVA